MLTVMLETDVLQHIGLTGAGATVEAINLMLRVSK